MLQKRNCSCGHALVLPSTAKAPRCPKCGSVVKASVDPSENSTPDAAAPDQASAEPPTPPPISRPPVRRPTAETTPTTRPPEQPTPPPLRKEANKEANKDANKDAEKDAADSLAASAVDAAFAEPEAAIPETASPVSKTPASDDAPPEDRPETTSTATESPSQKSPQPPPRPANPTRSESRKSKSRKRRSRKSKASAAEPPSKSKPQTAAPAAANSPPDTTSPRPSNQRDTEQDAERPKPPPLPARKPDAKSSDPPVNSTVPSAAPTEPEPEVAAPPVASSKPRDTEEETLITSFDAPPVQSGDAVEYGVEHDDDRLSGCYLFAGSMLIAALFGMAPALYRGFIYVMSEDPPRMETWTFLLSAVCGLQAAYGVYLLQAPDWCTARVSAIATVVFATLYAASLGAIVFSSSNGGVVRFLQIFSYHSDYRAAGWCFIMLLVTSMIAFFGGRFALNWQQEETEMELL